jgi:hypothetical protein
MCQSLKLMRLSRVRTLASRAVLIKAKQMSERRGHDQHLPSIQIEHESSRDSGSCLAFRYSRSFCLDCGRELGGVDSAIARTLGGSVVS